MNNLVVKKQMNLITFLRNNLTNKSKNNIKTFLTKKMVKVNNNIVTNASYVLYKNDIVEIKNNFIYDKYTKLNIPIIYEDENIIVVDKPSNLLTVSSKKENKKTLYNIVRNYLISFNKYNKVFIIHRLDKGTSGVIMFAKNMKIKNLYQNNWDKLVINKEYLAITESGIKDSGTIKSSLKENSEGIVYTVKNGGKFAVTSYKKLAGNKKYDLLKVNIKTGRKNQIRVHLSSIKYPIVGDSKYGSKVNPIKRLCLHSSKLEIINPITKKKMLFLSDSPEIFSKLILVKKN